jgi:hypothetical protein
MNKQKLEEIITILNSALENAEKFDLGNDSAGQRLRANAQDAKVKLHELRIAIQEERNSRKKETKR